MHRGWILTNLPEVNRLSEPGCLGKHVSKPQFGVALALVLSLSLSIHAAEGGHYTPGVLNLRDWSVPDSGLYFQQYGVGYHSTDLKDATGVSSQAPGTKPSITSVLIAPAFTWSIGGNFSMMVEPTFGSTGPTSVLHDLNFQGFSGNQHWSVGDMFIQPIRMGWHAGSYSFCTAYGFYAPVGRHDANSTGNVGLGFWSHQFSGSAYYYPDQSTALMFTTVYEANHAKYYTPGGHVGLEYGVVRDVSRQVEVGITAFDYFQVSDDRGTGQPSPTVHQQSHGIGPEAALTIVPNRLRANFRILWEHGVKSRFNGAQASVTLTYVLTGAK